MKFRSKVSLGFGPRPKVSLGFGPRLSNYLDWRALAFSTSSWKHYYLDTKHLSSLALYQDLHISWLVDKHLIPCSNPNSSDRLRNITLACRSVVISMLLSEHVFSGTSLEGRRGYRICSGTGRQGLYRARSKFFRQKNGALTFHCYSKPNKDNLWCLLIISDLGTINKGGANDFFCWGTTLGWGEVGC